MFHIESYTKVAGLSESVSLFLGAVELLALVFEAELTEVVEVLCWFLYHCNISLENVSPKSPLLILFVAFFGGGGGSGLDRAYLCISAAL